MAAGTLTALTLELLRDEDELVAGFLTELRSVPAYGRPRCSHGRLLIVQRYRSGWAKAHIAAATGISRKRVAVRIERYAVRLDATGADGQVTHA